VDLHGPEKALEHRDDTFWIAESNEKVHTHILIHASTHTLIYSFTHILIYSYTHTLTHIYTHMYTHTRNEKAELRVEFAQTETITEIWIMTR
jgi:hypothetical protein